MPNYDTDSQVLMRFDVDFYAADQTSADTAARNLINKVFGAATASLMQVTASSNVALSGEAISGANYHYQYDLNIRMGASDNATDDPIYNTVFAATAADALTSIQTNAQRITNINNMPVKILYLRLTP